MRLRDTWHQDDDGHTACIWCGRFASLCVIENPCVPREKWEHDRDLMNAANEALRLT